MSKNRVIKGCGFHHVAIRAHDFEASVRFYTEALGFVERIRWGDEESRAVMLDTGDGNYIEIFSGGATDPKPEGSILHFALRADNCDSALNRARAAGATIIMESKDILIPSVPDPTPIRIAFCKGPDGEVIEFFESRTT